MNTPLNKNLMKKLFSLAGVATASVALSLPAFALTQTEASSSNQRLNPQTLAQDSRSIGDPSNDDITTPANLRNNDRTSNTEQVREEVVQSDRMNNDRMNQRSSEFAPDGMNNGDRMMEATPASTTGGINNTEPSSTIRNLYGTSDMNDDGKIRHLITGGDSVTGTIFRCVNNPNPNCG